MMGSSCWGWGPGFFFGGPLGMIVGLVFWALIIYGIFYLISRLLKNRQEGINNLESPIETLKRRYARGDIDADEFARRKSILES